jgi:hypothetical protein
MQKRNPSPRHQEHQENLLFLGFAWCLGEDALLIAIHNPSMSGC